MWKEAVGAWGILKSMVFAVLILAACGAADAQTTEKQWQAKAIVKYPSLGVGGSPLNKRFVEEYAKRRITNPAFFTKPEWPLLLADELAASGANRPAAAAGRPEPESKPEPANGTVPAAKTEPAKSPKPSDPSAPSGKPEAAGKPVAANAAAPTDHSEEAGKATATNAGGPAAWLARQWRDYSEFVIPGILLCAGVGSLIFVRFFKARQERKRWERVQEEADAYLAAVEKTKGLPAVTTSLLLPAGEYAYYCAPSNLYEAREVRRYYSYSLTDDVALGSSWPGAAQQQLARIDSGTLTITNQRLIYAGPMEERTVLLANVISIETSRDSVQISSSCREKSMLFGAANPLILAMVIRTIGNKWERKVN